MEANREGKEGRDAEALAKKLPFRPNPAARTGPSEPGSFLPLWASKLERRRDRVLDTEKSGSARRRYTTAKDQCADGRGTSGFAPWMFDAVRSKYTSRSATLVSARNRPTEGIL
jgi:hypothetical protein